MQKEVNGKKLEELRETARDGEAWLLDDPHKVETWKKEAVSRLTKPSMKETLGAPRHYQHLQMFNENTR
jgi:hypothetical protein